MEKNKRLQWRISTSIMTKGKRYISIGIPKNNNKGFSIRFGYGYVEDLKKYHDDPIEKIKSILPSFSLALTPEDAKKKLDREFKGIKEPKKEYYKKYEGLDFLKKIFAYLNPFKNIEINEKIKLNDVITNFIFKDFNKHGENWIPVDEDDVDGNLENFYNILDFISDNKMELLKKANSNLLTNYKLNFDEIWYSTTTYYLESYDCFDEDDEYDEWPRRKITRDKVTLALATDKNGVLLNFKLFLPGESKSSTLIPFVTELQEIYNINSATIVAKNEICTKKNIEALRQIGWELINNTTAVVKNKKQSGLISTKLKDLKDSELRELYSREDLIRNTWSFLKNELFVTSRISLSAEHVDKYSCLCLMSLMVLRYTIYIINSELGLQGKNKFTESKLNDIAMGVIRIIILTDGVETDSFKFSNSHTDEIWNLYESIKKCLLNKYPQIENNK